MILQNMIQPGVNITFKSKEGNEFQIGQRGIMTMPMKVNWGEDQKLTEITFDDIKSGVFKNMFGDSNTLLLELALRGCKTVLLYSINKGTKASATIGETLTVTAKYGGEFGNNISIGIKDSKIITDVDGEVVDEQTVGNFNELIDNDWVTFDGEGTPSTTAFTKLSSGTNGSESNNYDDFFRQIKTKEWNVLAAVDAKMNKDVEQFVMNLREEEGIKVQGVVFDESPNYEGIIKLKNQSVIYDGIKITPEQLTAYVAGITAGANVNTSNTNRLTPFSSIVDEMTNTEIDKALINGFFVFGYRANRSVKCVQDINSFTDFSATKNKDFSKNKIIRVLDEINNTITSTFEMSYEGKVNNNMRGRDAFKSSLIDYFDRLQTAEAIEGFSSKDIVIKQGNNKESVYVEVSVQPVDAMEKLYMLVRVR